MKLPIFLLLATCLPVLHLLGNEDLYTKSCRVDGLPLRLAEAGLADQKPKPGTKSIDLTGAFNRLGCPTEDGFVHYLTESGILVRHLDQKAHQSADSIIADLYRDENLLAICRCYYDLLAPLSAEDRLKKVIQIGYVPDPLVAALITRLCNLKGLNRVEQGDPFTPDPLPPKQFTEKDQAQIKTLEKQITSLLDISLQRLKQQLAVLDETPTPRPADKTL